MTCLQPMLWTAQIEHPNHPEMADESLFPQPSTEHSDDDLIRFLLEHDPSSQAATMEIEYAAPADDLLPGAYGEHSIPPCTREEINPIDALQHSTHFSSTSEWHGNHPLDFNPPIHPAFDTFNDSFPDNLHAFLPSTSLSNVPDILTDSQQQHQFQFDRGNTTHPSPSLEDNACECDRILDATILEFAPKFREKYFVELMTRYCRKSKEDVAGILNRVIEENEWLNYGNIDDYLGLYGGLGSPHNWVHSYAIYVIYNNLDSKGELVKKWDYHKSAMGSGVTFNTWRSRMSSLDEIIVGNSRQEGMGHSVLGIMVGKDLNPMRHAVADDISLFLDMWACVKASGISIPLQTINNDIERIVERLVERVTEPVPAKPSAKGKTIENGAGVSRPRLTFGVTKHSRTLPWPNKTRNDLGSDSENESESHTSPLSADGSRFRLLLTRKTTRHVTFTPRIQSMLERFEKIYNAETKRFIPGVMKEFKAVLELDDEESRWMLLQLAYLTGRRNDLREVRRLNPGLYRICKNVDGLTTGDWGACFDAVCLPEMLVMRDYLETSNEIWKMKLDVERDYPQVDHDINYKNWREVFERVVHALY